MSEKIGRRRFLRTGMLVSAVPLAFSSVEEKMLLAAMERGVDVEEEKYLDMMGCNRQGMAA